MRNTKAFATIVSILTAILMIFMVSTTVFATGTPEINLPENLPEYLPEALPEVLPEVLPEIFETEPPYEEEPTSIPEEEPEEQEETEQEQTTDDNYLMYGDDLPEVESQEVVEPTTMPIPDIEITDISLMGGVIAWLCVAVGIAVIAGVLVSQRTKQVQKPRDKRRR